VGSDTGNHAWEVGGGTIGVGRLRVVGQQNERTKRFRPSLLIPCRIIELGKHHTHTNEGVTFIILACSTRIQYVYKVSLSAIHGKL
jgi:hypothetical protein